MGAWIDCSNQIKTVVAAVTGIVDVHQGYSRYSDADNWEQSVTALSAETEGRFRFALDTIDYVPQDVSHGHFYAELAIYVPKDVSSDMTTAWALALKVQEALGLQSNFQQLGMFPGRILMSLDRIDVIESGGIAYFIFGRPGSGGIDMVDP